MHLLGTPVGLLERLHHLDRWPRTAGRSVADPNQDLQLQGLVGRQLLDEHVGPVAAPQHARTMISLELDLEPELPEELRGPAPVVRLDIDAFNALGSHQLLLCSVHWRWASR